MQFTRMIGLAAAAVLGLAATAASAEGYYVGGHYFDWKVKSSDAPTLDASGGRLLGGYMLNDYVGFEIHAAQGGTDEVAEGTVEGELDRLWGAFARFNMPVYRGWGNLFALVGYAQGEVEVSSAVDSETVDESGPALGAGVEVAILPGRLYLSADHVQYIKETENSGLENVEGTATSIGLRYSF